METTHLGGRISLLDPAGLTGEQKAIYDRLTRTMVKWADKSGFQSTTEGDRLIGPFNPVLLSPGITPAFLDLQDAEQANTSLDDRVRQVVILAVGAVWRSDYELYAHAKVARTAGLPENTIKTLVSGAVPDELSETEKLAARFARALFAGPRIEAALYQDAQAAFGARGLVDIVYLAGCYHIVCGLLNAFEIPAPLEQAQAGPGRTKQARLTTIALFPVKSFLENLAVRGDNSVLVTSMNARELFYVPPSSGDAPVEPVLLHRFAQPTTGLVEIEPDLFLVSTSNVYTTHESFLHRIDLRGFQPGSQVRPEMVFRFLDTARG